MDPTIQYKVEDKPVYYSSIANQRQTSPTKVNFYEGGEKIVRTGNVNTVTYHEPGKTQNIQSFQTSSQPGTKTVETIVYHDPPKLQSQAYEERRQSFSPGRPVTYKQAQPGYITTQQTKIYQQPVKNQTYIHHDGGRQSITLKAGKPGVAYQSGYQSNSRSAGELPTAVGQGKQILYQNRQVTQQIQRPIVRKVYSNKSIGRTEERAVGAPSKDSQKNSCCSPALLALLLLLGLIGLVLGLLFGLGVIGGKGENQGLRGGPLTPLSAQPVLIDGAQYHPNSITVQNKILGEDDRKISAYEALNTIYAADGGAAYYQEQENGQGLRSGASDTLIDGATYYPNSISVENYRKVNDQVAERIPAGQVYVPGNKATYYPSSVSVEHIRARDVQPVRNIQDFENYR